MSVEEEAKHAVRVGREMARLLGTVPDIELRLAIVGTLGEQCGIVDLTQNIKRAMEQYNKMVGGAYDA